MYVKICGITNLEDAMIAAEAGADYLGFIFYPPSPRSVSPERTREITTQLKNRLIVSPLLVGVFVNETVETMAQHLDTCQLDLAQLSGDEVPALIGDTESPIYGRAYKAIRPASAAEAEAEAEWYAVPRQRTEGRLLKRPSLLIDTYHPTLRGGTGLSVEWDIVARLFEQTAGIMLAGGLNSDNVGSAVAQLKPFAVDVASGVEAYPGKKDYEKLRAFIVNAKHIIDN